MKQPTVKLRRLTEGEIREVPPPGFAHDRDKLVAEAQFSLIKQDLEKQGIKVEVIE